MGTSPAKRAHAVAVKNYEMKLEQYRDAQREVAEMVADAVKQLDIAVTRIAAATEADAMVRASLSSEYRALKDKAVELHTPLSDVPRGLDRYSEDVERVTSAGRAGDKQAVWGALGYLVRRGWK